MYGMIHRAARDMVTEQHGPDVWAAVLARSGVGGDKFISAESYSDETTMALIGAIVAELNVEPHVALEAFGRHWVEFAASSPYAGLLNRAGGDLPTFLDNLDRMHASIKAAMPAAEMPSFAVVDSAPGRLTVEYRSSRNGLAPFVRGILSGLLERFGLKGSIADREAAGAVRFDISYARV